MAPVAGLAPSAGSTIGLILAALETRYRAFVFIGAGLPGSYRAIIAAANPINFAPHIRVRKLILRAGTTRTRRFEPRRHRCSNC